MTDTSGIFRDIFQDWKPPEKDIVGKLSDAYTIWQDYAVGKNLPEQDQKAIEAFNKYSGFGPGMLGGPMYVKQAIQSGRIPRSIFDLGKEVVANIKSGNLRLNDNIYKVPGALDPDFFRAPIINRLYGETGALPMPYTKGKTLVTMGEMGSPKLDPAKLNDLTIRARLQSSGVPITELADWKDLELFYPQIAKNYKVRVADEPLSGKNYSASNHYNSNTGGGISILDNPEVLDNPIVFQKLLNHEGQHQISSFEGLSGGGAPSEFMHVRPAGLETFSPRQIYQRLLDETLAKVAERDIWNIPEAIVQVANGYPILHKEKLVGPGGKKDWVRTGKDYGSDGYHYGKNWYEYFQGLTNKLWD
jgi:hypothetical protein